MKALMIMVLCLSASTAFADENGGLSPTLLADIGLSDGGERPAKEELQAQHEQQLADKQLAYENRKQDCTAETETIHGPFTPDQVDEIRQAACNSSSEGPVAAAVEDLDAEGSESSAETAGSESNLEAASIGTQSQWTGAAAAR